MCGDEPVRAWIEASRSGVVEAIESALPPLLQLGESAASASDAHGLSALHHAALRGHEKACRYLLATVGMPPDGLSGSTSSPLLARIQLPHERVTLSRFTALHVAALQGNVRAARALRSPACMGPCMCPG
eukprot:scaffold174715_cov29-Tisochrysis_lutea.AAC.4